MRRVSLSLFCLAMPIVFAALATQDPSFLSAQTAKEKAKGKAKVDPKIPPRPQFATPIDKIKVAKDFQVELLYSVPKETYGSWVCMCVLPDGKLVVSDQYGLLYRVAVPAIGEKGEPKIVKIPVEIGGAQGLLWAFDSLYVVVNAPKKSGLYRVTASQKDGELDTVKMLKKFEDAQGGDGGGEHGPHAIIKHPDGKRLTIVVGNQTKLVDYTSTKVPPYWGEDHLLPRMPDGRGFMAGVKGPGGAVYNITPDGKEWELFSVGFRNEYDAAYNHQGDLFTYDADMEWDFNTPWYRPTRVCQVTSGSEFGWRNGAGKYPVYYPDSLPGICDIGPGSPTGIAFGYGAKFPKKYQDALFICDWSYGKMYAVHMTPNGSVKKGTAEEFISGVPLQLTDVVINPIDGAMYFTIGGRKTQSGLYRVTYTGKESTETQAKVSAPTAAEKELATLEKLHVRSDAKAIEAIWPELGDSDRFIRFAARVALEHQDVKAWKDLALNEKNPQTAITALLALVRVSAACPEHDKEAKKKGDPALRAQILESLGRIDFVKLTTEQKLEMVRVYQVLFHRFGTPTAEERKAWLAKFAPAFPNRNRFVDGELLQIFVFLQDDTIAPKAIKLLAEAPTQEEQIEYARSLRMLKTGWTPETRTAFFSWINKAYAYKGGNSFGGFLDKIKADAIATLSDKEKVALKTILEAQPATGTVAVQPPRPLVKKYTLAELSPIVDKGLKAGGRDFDKGRKLFAAANCFACHRYDNEGGAQGPDLSGASGRFNTHDLLETIIDPSKEVSDQYANAQIDTLDGKTVVGRIINFSGDDMMLLPDMTNPNGIVKVNRNNVDRMQLSKLSPMPAGLLDTLKEDEILDLMAYLLSRGDRNHAAFKK